MCVCVCEAGVEALVKTLWQTEKKILPAANRLPPHIHTHFHPHTTSAIHTHKQKVCHYALPPFSGLEGGGGVLHYQIKSESSHDCVCERNEQEGKRENHQLSDEL